MKQAELFEKTTGLLIEAYNNGRLAVGKCSSCAVGNIVGDSWWGSLFCTGRKLKHETGVIRSNNTHSQVYMTDCLKEKNNLKRKLKQTTGYKWQQLAEVEFIFETTRANLKTRLIAVLEYLGKLHKASNEDMLEVIAQLN